MMHQVRAFGLSLAFAGQAPISVAVGAARGHLLAVAAASNATREGRSTRCGGRGRSEGVLQRRRELARRSAADGERRGTGKRRDEN